MAIWQQLYKKQDQQVKPNISKYKSSHSKPTQADPDGA